MAKWTESGILRKANKEKHEDLLVFGYACKLFRDDVKALYIDQGKHLIPWMGEDSLKIDRYDCRGALSELKQYEAGSGGVSRLSEMSESERRMEQMCDEERYYSLKYNEEELEMYKEEELKRLQQKNNEVQYNYDVPTDPKNSQEVSEVVEEEDKPFIPPPDLNVPADVDAPETVKVNARIEKTALFISKQGPQMEILIKTKQADNPQFRFLNKDDRLHKYYKFLLSAIKSGQYKIQQEEEPDANVKREEGGDEDETGDHYLHPSLLAASVQPVGYTFDTIVYVDCNDSLVLAIIYKFLSVYFSECLYRAGSRNGNKYFLYKRCLFSCSHAFTNSLLCLQVLCRWRVNPLCQNHGVTLFLCFRNFVQVSYVFLQPHGSVVLKRKTYPLIS
uniref:SURP motif domain-containing protein n=1 Tax=Photinus pyralis TaxID=7054 RepID=A0A1Y1KDE9_PHOPY